MFRPKTQNPSRARAKAFLEVIVIFRKYVLFTKDPQDDAIIAPRETLVNSFYKKMFRFLLFIVMKKPLKISLGIFQKITNL